MLGAMATMLPPSLPCCGPYLLRGQVPRPWNLDTTLATLVTRCRATRRAVTKGTVSLLLRSDVPFAYPGQMVQETAMEQPPASTGRMIDATRLRVAIARLSRRLRHHELAGLTPTQLSALATVERSGPMRLGDVAAAEG